MDGLGHEMGHYRMSEANCYDRKNVSQDDDARKMEKKIHAREKDSSS